MVSAKRDGLFTGHVPACPLNLGIGRGGFEGRKNEVSPN